MVANLFICYTYLNVNTNYSADISLRFTVLLHIQIRRGTLRLQSSISLRFLSAGEAFNFVGRFVIRDVDEVAVRSKLFPLRSGEIRFGWTACVRLSVWNCDQDRQTLIYCVHINYVNREIISLHVWNAFRLYSFAEHIADSIYEDSTISNLLSFANAFSLLVSLSDGGKYYEFNYASDRGRCAERMNASKYP